MTAINEGSATTYDKYNFYGQALQQVETDFIINLLKEIYTTSLEEKWSE